MNDVIISVQTGKRKDGKGEWKALKITIGEWTTMIFPKTTFEMNYIQRILDENKEK